MSHRDAIRCGGGIEDLSKVFLLGATMGIFDKVFGGVEGSEPFGPQEGFAEAIAIKFRTDSTLNNCVIDYKDCVNVPSASGYKNIL